MMNGLFDRARRVWLVRWTIRIGAGMRGHSAFLAASAMAFNFFLSFIPLIALFGFVLGHFVKEQGAAALLAPLGGAVPFVRDIATSELERMAGASVTVAPLSVVGFLWVTSSGTVGLIDTFEVALGTTRRPWWLQRLIALAWVIGMLAAVSLSVWLVVRAEDVFVDSSLPIARRLTAWFDSRAPTILLVLVAAVSVAGLALLYRFAVVHADNRRRVVWPGAFASALSLVVVTWAFSAYVQRLSRYAVFYGSLAAVATLLIWLYLVSLALLLGAELNAQLETRAAS